MSKILPLFRGIAIGSLAGTLLLALSAIAGLVDLRSGRVFFVAAGMAAAAVLIDASDARLSATGSSLVGIGALSAGLATGYGWLEYSMIGGALLGALWLLTGEQKLRDPTRWFRWGGVVLALLVLVLLPLILDGATLVHDESAYGVKTRQWLEGTPDTGWSPHRGIGMSLLGYPVLGAGGSEPGLRLIGLAGAMALAAGAWGLGRRLGGPVVGAMAALGVIAGPAVLSRGTEYLSDVPAAGLLVFCAVILWRELGDRELPTYRLLWALPLAWAAFYLRYQSIVSLALLAVVALFLWWDKVRRRPGPAVWLVVIGAIGLIPHVIHSIGLTGEPWGILTYTGRIAGRAYVGEGLSDYAQQLPWDLAGYLGPVALVAALVGMATAWRDHSERQGYLFLLIPALAQVVALGLISHGEPRFLFFPIALVVVAGAMTIHRWASQTATSWGLAVASAVGIVVIGSLALSSTFAGDWVRNRTASNEPVELAAVEVSSLAGGASCGVFTSYTPQVTFYSGCASEVFGVVGEPEAAVNELQGEAKFVVLVENGKRQPTGAALAGYLALADGQPVVVQGERRDATILRLTG